MANNRQNFPTREARVPYSGKPSTRSTERTTQQKSKNAPRKRPSKPAKRRKKPKIPPRAAMLCILALIVFMICFALLHKNGSEIFVGENSMGILKDTSITAEEITKNLEAQLKTQVGTNVKINEEIKAERLHISGARQKDVCTLEYMLPNLKAAVTYKVEAAVIFVDGGAVAPLATEDEAKQVLRQIQATYYPEAAQQNTDPLVSETPQTDTTQTDKQDAASTTDKQDTEKQSTDSKKNTATTEQTQDKDTKKDTAVTEQTEGTTSTDTQTTDTTEHSDSQETVTSNAEIRFVEAVKIEKQFVDSKEILKPEAAFAKLTSTTPVTATYTIQSGDRLGTIAAEYDMTLEELLVANEGMTLQTPIVVGQTINVTVQKPMISVQSTETQTLTTVEKKQYETQYDSSKPASYQRVLQQGKDGQKRSTIQITRVNGFVTEEKEVSKEIIQEPVTEIIIKGTQ